MKILNAQQIRSADEYSISSEPIASIDLMERAAGKCFDWMQSNLDLKNTSVFILCGPGNNGGDGLVLARLLHNLCPVRVGLINTGGAQSDDLLANLSRLDGLNVSIVAIDEKGASNLDVTEDIVLDALFGSGLNKPIDGWLKQLIQKLNALEALKMAIDLPSGLFAENNQTNDLSAVFVADVCLTFQCPKLAFMLPETGIFCGEWEVLDIGLNRSFIESLPSNYYTTDAHQARKLYRSRPKFGHKGDFGHALIYAGSKGKMGAATLASRACLRSGAGLVTNYSPQCGLDILQISVPESMTKTSKGKLLLNDFPKNLEEYDVLGIGPGLGTKKETALALGKLLKQNNKPVVLDADALNILSEEPSFLKYMPANAVLTPHPGEFKRLVGAWKNDAERLTKQVEFSKKHQVVLVLKGAHTSVSAPNGKVYFNTTGNPGMATAGSGDVLLGVITGLLSQGYPALDAARLGVFLHGLAGDFAAAEWSEESLISGDIIHFLPPAFQSLTT